MTKFNDKVQKHVLVICLVLGVGYTIWVGFAQLFSMIIINLLQVDYLPGLFLNFALKLIFAAVLIIFIIPFLLHLPNGKVSLNEYRKDIQLKNEAIARNIGLGILCTVIFLMVTLIYPILSGAFVLDLNRIFGYPIASTGNLQGYDGWFGFIRYINAGIWEEMIFRGIILILLLKKYPIKETIVISSLIFASLHVVNIFWNPDVFGLIGQIIFTLAFGVTCAYLITKTNNLIPAMTLHYLHNTLSGIFYWPNGDQILIAIVVTISVYVAMVLSILLVNFITKK